MTKIRSSRTSRVRDRRGSGGGGGLSIPGLGRGGPRGGGTGIPMGVGAGGGLIGIIILAAVLILPQLLGEGSTTSDVSSEADGPTACESDIEQIVCGAVDDVSIYWEGQYPESFQGAYPGADTVFFSGSTTTGCGRATAQTGPFYCPADELVYFDLGFLQQLQDDFDATGDLAAQYIVAHEYGHHVQNMTGIAGRVGQLQQQFPESANEFSVALELQADCFAGAWASSAAERGQFDRINEVEEALTAAEAVGDDRISESAGQDVNPESFTHGSADQRRSWFQVGYSTGDPEQCTTFDSALAP
ncbi:MAG: neutral zinc metallopeptidase [Ilumatobacteraceae bacterium]